MIRIVAALALVGTLLFSTGKMLWAQAVPAQVAKERGEIMEKIWPDYYRDMSQVARGENTDLSVVVTKASGAVDALKKFATLFPPGSGREAVPTTRAKPEIWTQRAEFDKAVQTLIAETTALGEAAKSGKADAVKAQWAKVAEACGACHGGPKKSGGKFRFEE